MHDTETLDKLYLEWSQFTRARTSSEIRLEKENRELREALECLPLTDLINAAREVLGSRMAESARLFDEVRLGVLNRWRK